MTDRDVWLRFRAALKTAMERKGLKGYELAKAAGIWPTNISNYLNKGSLPNGANLMKIAAALGMEPGDLIPGSGRALPTRDGKQHSDRLIGGRDVLDELEVLLRELRKRWESQGRGQAVAGSAVHQQRHQAPTRRSKGT